MKRTNTFPEQAPSETPLRAKYLLGNRKSLLLIVPDLTDKQLRMILEIVSAHGEPPALKQ